MTAIYGPGRPNRCGLAKRSTSLTFEVPIILLLSVRSIESCIGARSIFTLAKFLSGETSGEIAVRGTFISLTFPGDFGREELDEIFRDVPRLLDLLRLRERLRRLGDRRFGERLRRLGDGDRRRRRGLFERRLGLLDGLFRRRRGDRVFDRDLRELFGRLLNTIF